VPETDQAVISMEELSDKEFFKTMLRKFNWLEKKRESFQYSNRET
jgi:hypothetical protein